MRRQICIYINIYTHTHFVPHHHDKQILSHYYSVFYWLKSTDDWAQFSASQGGFQISVFFFCLRNITRHSTDKIHRWKFFMQKCIEWCRIIMCYRCKETGWHVLKRDSRKNGKKTRRQQNECVFAPMFARRRGLRQQMKVCNWSCCNLPGSCFECLKWLVSWLMD